jgi:hypothetical protein
MGKYDKSGSTGDGERTNGVVVTLFSIYIHVYFGFGCQFIF